MADSIREQIVKDLVAALNTITRDNGYSLTVKSVQRFFETGQSLVDPEFILVEEGEDRAFDGALKGASSLTARSFDVFVGLALVLDPDTDARSGDEAMNAFRSDVEKAVMTDRTRSGLAIDTKPPTWDPISVEEGKANLYSVGKFTFDYRHLDKDPSVPN